MLRLNSTKITFFLTNENRLLSENWLTNRERKYQDFTLILEADLDELLTPSFSERS